MIVVSNQKPTRAQKRAFWRLFKIVVGAIFAMMIFLAVAPSLFIRTYLKNPDAAFSGFQWSFEIWQYVIGVLTALIAGYVYREFARDYTARGKKLPWWLRLHAWLLTGRKLESLTKNIPPDEEEES